MRRKNQILLLLLSRDRIFTSHLDEDGGSGREEELEDRAREGNASTMMVGEDEEQKPTEVRGLENKARVEDTHE